MKTTLRLLAAACLYVTTAFAQNQLTANLTVTNQEIVGAAAGSIPVTAFEVDSTSTSSPRGIMSAQFNSGTDGARFHGRKARGTRAAPTVIVTGDNLTRWVGSGYDGSNFLEDASIIFGTEGTIAATRLPTNIQFVTATDAAPSVLTEAARFDSAQRLRFGGSAGGYISGTSGAISLTGAGTNQSITLTPSGSGNVTIGLGNSSGGYLQLGSNNFAFNTSSANAIMTGTASGLLIFRNHLDSASVAVLNDNGQLLLGGLTTVGTGLLQLPAATTTAGGIGFGTADFFYRSFAGQLSMSFGGSIMDFSAGRIVMNGNDLAIGSNTGAGNFKALSGNGATALTLDSSQNATFAGTTTNFHGAAAAANTVTQLVKSVASIANNTATDVLTVTIPNAAQSARLHVELAGSLGAGGAIGANEATGVISYDFAITRTSGVATVVGTSTAYGSTTAAVAGAATITISAAATAMTGTVSATQTFTIQVTIARGSGSSTNHTCQVRAEVLNANATGITIS